MADINVLIKEKLEGCPQEAQELIIQAIELASRVQGSALSDQLNSVVRQIVRG
ncbi:MAG: hypothetical protein WCI27_09625 [Candidatus Omnitrophota bacterium]